ncbi:hypothetical protein AA23498_2129 [Acetobacter nitrogenifigens DSM 23921 = NBRC 105050]|uniref:Uncharacterized protein n=2 Tax=Acetobacter TaxID=434 RepID=A0A511XF61_9PROT|nr:MULTISPECIES: hypothetical protein [Acetobacter]MBO1361637.1 hypothetical protein [Acetobacter sacchari]GBQ94844.1 hypothetical protein AA23498_2129 [Acetobacter nitrogenifigens DSM 23921 = NBRC 105050]GEN61587.1 hypothetical protein ANI02nite_34710 [Acetobacter nitrogenifigens DSM 23921 = NBRC 105050]
MTDNAQAPEGGAQQVEVSEELTKCAMVIEHAIEHLLEENHAPLAVASALLGGSLGLLARTMDKDTILKILDSAVQSVRSGELQDAEHARRGHDS